ncbi:MAG: sigma-70 family RNA polymerase sigma factor [Firmicutes bacterium]|nr:sigma-70 family RNA polymerase sigma factor [Bacillota bacterium]
MLSVEETSRLLTLAKDGCNQSKTTLIESNAPLIKSIIKRYIGKGVDYDDLFQLGSLGFVKAINKYDSNYNVKFTTYAVPLIAGEVKRFLRDDGAIKVSRSVKALYVQIKRLVASKSGEEYSPTIDDIASELGSTREEVIYAMEAAQMPLSLFDKSDKSGEGDEGLSLSERIPIAENTNLDDKIMIKNMLDSLELRDRKIIILRYFRNMTQSQVAEKLGISQVQVSRIEQKIISQFRDDFGSEVI